MKALILIILFINVIGCTLEQFHIEQDPFKEVQPPVDMKKPSIEEFAKKNHGVVNVHRHGPGYDIVFSLNAGDSDMIFTMDLPAGGESFFPEIQERLLDENERINKSLSDDKSAKSDSNVLLPKSIEEDDFFNKKSLSLYSRSTKHMLNAQALFYRKAYWKALEETNKAVSLIPKSAQAYALKGSIYFKMGRKSDAKVAWKAALDLDPNLVDVKQSLSLIE